ncbi:Uncharacterized conserved protein (DUF2276) [Mycobacteroides abscessus subsp. abscessus]|nr:Uncharacterized conserved protein (DUF2276) [Mycobacteroides abscessus subsp. abscessus]
MPASVHLSFDTPEGVPATPRRLHAALSAVLDLPPGISPTRAAQFPTLAHRPIHGSGGVKPYSLGELSHSESTFGVEVRFLDDRLIDTLDAWLSWGGVMRLGAGTDNDAVLIASEGQIISQASWEELAERDQDTAWEIRLVTPTTFSSKGNHVPSLSPATIATSLQQRWWAWNRRLAPPRIDRNAMASVLTTQDFTRTSLVSLAMPRNAGQGRLSSQRIPAHEGYLRISGVDGTEATRIFSRLMALSAYTNVGSHTSYGMGVIDAVAA